MRRADAASHARQATLALMLQPEQNARSEFLYVPTPSPYGPSGPPTVRRFSRLELMGRLGDEVLLDRWLCAVDQRLSFLAKEWMQRRLLVQGGGDDATDGNDNDGNEDDAFDAALDAIAADGPETEADAAVFHPEDQGVAVHVRGAAAHQVWRLHETQHGQFAKHCRRVMDVVLEPLVDGANLGVAKDLAAGALPDLLQHPPKRK